MSTAPVITIFVRHSGDCKQTDEQYKRCKCRKHFRWFKDGVQYRQSASTRSWEEAETLKRDLQDQLAGRMPVAEADSKARLIKTCVDTFIKEKTLEGISEFGVGDYERELGRFERYCISKGVLTIDRVTRELLVDYAATWPSVYPSSWTRWRVRSRIHSFLQYCDDSNWITKAPKMPSITPDEPETTPLTQDEYDALLAAIPRVVKNTSNKGDKNNRKKAHALFQLMRRSGLAIRDALTIERTEIQFNEETDKFGRVVTSRQKTGTHVSVPIPPDVAKEVLEVAALNENPKYIFFHGNCPERNFVVAWAKRVKLIFEEAKIEQGGQHMRSHRLRDTFAVDLLQKGVPMEEVSKLLGHTSIKTTERYYAKWCKGRQERADSLVTSTWAA